MSYERNRRRNPDYNPAKPECCPTGSTSTTQAPTYSMQPPTYSMQRTMDGRKRPQLKTDTMPQRLVGETYFTLPFQLFPTTKSKTSSPNIHDLGSMHSDINTALKQSSDAFAVAKAAWNNQIDYFKVSFREIDKRQKALATAFATLAGNLTLNNRELIKDQKDIEDNSSAWKVVQLAKAIINAIKRIIKTFAKQSTDFDRVKTETKNLAASFGKLAANVTKLKKVR